MLALFAYNQAIETERSANIRIFSLITTPVHIQVNRFLVQGEGNIKYTYNNGLIAKDEKLAATNFLNALEKLPGYIAQEQKKISEIQKDLPVL